MQVLEARPPPATLYERIGGKAAIDSLIDEFYGRVLADPGLAPYFSRTSMESLRRMQREFFAAALDGPVQYTGRPIIHAHQHLKIRLVDLQAFVGHLFETLRRYDLKEQECYDIICRLNLYTNDVVSAGTGIVG
ncbi:MAG TPA: group 1 truncated hemoglobin [Nevskia sp.]|jgi:hemoglobin|nr:group 1 truncated hemoglobin [Nevskia sp.]